MPDLDAELLERVARWCAEAGRTTVPAEIRRALAPLGWDELLAVRALLADPPPARPLGPFALADLARGTPLDAAAERERDGRYPSLAAADAAADGAVPSPAPVPARPPRASGPRRARGPGIVIRRARDAAPPSAAVVPPARPLTDALLLPEGRAVLERLVRRHGARRTAILAALAEGWRDPDGGAPSDADLSRLLDHHGLARAFARRERDELLHGLRAAGGLRAAAAARLGLEREAFDAALARTGAAAEAERIREARRAELRARGTLAQRVRVLLGDAPRLEDLGLLGEIEEDLRRRLPEHLRALSTARGSLLLALSRSLSVAPAEARALADRFGLSLEPPRIGASPASPLPPRKRGEAGRGAAGRGGAARGAAARGPRPDRPRAGKPRPGERAPATPRQGKRPPRAPGPGRPRAGGGKPRRRP